MHWLSANIKTIMLVSGVLTSTMIYATINPKAALLSTFGETLEGPVADILVRNWGALVALVGAMLIYGAFDPPARPFVLLVAGASKLTFITLVVAHRRQCLRGRAVILVVGDAIMVALYAGYLLGDPAA